jgi:hypothetical protein
LTGAGAAAADLPVDAVFTYVAGGVGEITFSVRSVLQYLPWIRRIHVVTDGQAPPVDPELLQSGRVRIVDHAEIIPDEYRPTFTSTAIESFLHRIPGLSEVFLYDNDDYLHFSPVPRDLFLADEGDGRVSLRLLVYPAVVRRLIHLLSAPLPGFLPKANAHTTGVSRAFAILRRRERLPWHRIVVPRHVTQVFRRSTAERLEREYADVLHQNRLLRRRTRQQISFTTLAYSLERHWHPHDRVRFAWPGRAEGIRMFDFLHCKEPGTYGRLWRRIEGSEAPLACLNNIPSFERESFLAVMRRKGLGGPLAG